MSDLIRREDVIKLVNQFVFGLCKEQNDEVRKTFNKYIEKMPTAFDIGKIVRELEEVDYTHEDVNSFIHLEDAIEIVKQGGVSDDVCEWKQTSTARYKTSCGYKLEEFFDTKACYCKQCGKKIKVVE